MRQLSIKSTKSISRNSPIQMYRSFEQLIQIKNWNFNWRFFFCSQYGKRWNGTKFICSFFFWFKKKQVWFVTQTYSTKRNIRITYGFRKKQCLSRYYTLNPNLSINLWYVQLVNSNELTTISDLQAQSIYSIRAQAFTTRGAGPLSPPVQVKTLQKMYTWEKIIRLSFECTFDLDKVILNQNIAPPDIFHDIFGKMLIIINPESINLTD